MSTKESHIYSINDCLIDGVTVYQDRAEVTRTIIFLPQIIGQHEIIINSVTMTSDPESIRVRGNGSCEILEVAHDIRTDKVEVSKSDVKILLDKIKEEEKLQKSITQEMSRLSNQRRLTQTYSDTILGKGKLKDDLLLGLDDAKNILQFYSDEMLRLDELEVQLDERLVAINESLTLLRNELKDLRHVNSQATIEKKRSIIILVNVQEIHEINLILTYVVSNSTWIPSYDLRMNSVQNTMDIYYYAEVIQSCGENWNDCNICLSTSNPAIGSSPPALPLRTIDWSWNCQPRYTGNNNSVNINFKSKKSNRLKSQFNSEYDSDDGNYNAREGSFSLMDDDVRSNNNNNKNNNLGAPGNGDNNVTENNQLNSDAGSTTFIIPRKVTIESDNKPHKVTVIITSFTPQIVHYVAASMSAFVYLQAKIQNTSNYPLLPSDKVSVFLDGNFVSITSIKQTSPGEFFNVFLGVDPSVKVQYMPCRTAQYTKGWLSGTEVKKYFYSTIIHNTKQRPIRVIVAEILPRASDEKIVIELLEPTPSSLTKASSETSPILNEQDVIASLDGFEGGNNSSTNGNNGEPLQQRTATTTTTQAWPRDFVTQNKFTNNIVWLKTIQGGEKTEIKFSYRVAWPQGQTIGIR